MTKQALIKIIGEYLELRDQVDEDKYKHNNHASTLIRYRELDTRLRKIAREGLE